MKNIIFLVSLISSSLFTISFAQSPLTPCQQAQLNAAGLIGEFVPNCQDDGSYVSTQCWASAEYCWCVDQDGVELPGTSIPSMQGMPDCSSNVDACLLIPDPGMCEGAFQKYYFNQETQQCQDFSWGGCGGVVPFESLAECEAAECAQPEENCCINPAWLNPNAMCGLIWDPVIGCDGIEYSNSCVAQAAGVSSWTDQSDSEIVLNWDCELQSEDLCEAYFLCDGGNPYLICSNLSTYNETDTENINLLWEFGDGFTTSITENPVHTFDSAGYYEVCLTISIEDAQSNQICVSTHCDSVAYMVPGNIWDCGDLGCYQPEFGAGGGQFSSLESCEAQCITSSSSCTSSSGIEIINVGLWENPNDPCDLGECTSDGQFLEIVMDCQEEMGVPCDGEWVEVEGQCCSECIEDTDCIDQDTVMSSIFFGGMSISSCSEAINYLIDGFGYSFEDACSWNGTPMFDFDGMILSDYCECSCADIETDLSYCDSISLNPILPLGAALVDSVLEVNIETYFSNYSIPYAGLMLIDDMGDTIAIETISTAGNVYGIFSNMSEVRELLLVNELVFPFTGELCVVEGLFAGTSNIICSYPVIWQYVGLDQIQNERKPRLLRMIDILGRDVKIHQSGQFLFYIYDDGTVDKKYTY
jgi:hypothetical protein